MTNRRLRLAGPLGAALVIGCGASAASAPSGDAGAGDATTSTSMGSDAAPAAVDGGDASAPSGDGGGPRCPAVAITASLLELVDAITTSMAAHAGAGTNAAVIPTAADRDAFASHVVSALYGDLAAVCALPPSYRMVWIGKDAGGIFVVAEVDANGAPAPSLFWGTYAAPRSAPFERVVVEAPHPIFDTHTEHEAADVFLHVNGGALAIAGSHRCANDALSACSGTTTACGGVAGPYHVSDAAHATLLPFFAVHDAISRATSAPFLQLHGNTQACPDGLVSDGSGAWSDAGIAAAFAGALEANGATVGRCGAGYPTSACDLCGTDNVEARATAGSSDACTIKGNAYGRFLHVEQQPALRLSPDGGAGGYSPVLAAAAAAFP